MKLTSISRSTCSFTKYARLSAETGYAVNGFVSYCVLNQRSTVNKLVEEPAVSVCRLMHEFTYDDVCSFCSGVVHS